MAGEGSDLRELALAAGPLTVYPGGNDVGDEPLDQPLEQALGPDAADAGCGEPATTRGAA